MDDPALQADRHDRALRALARLNRVASAHAPVVRALDAFEPSPPDRPLRVLDVASGAGDLPLAIARHAAARGRHIELGACDISDRAIDHARARAARAGVTIDFHQIDALRDPLPAGYDVLVCTLFLHHLDEDDAVELLRRMSHGARMGVVVSDLRRCPRGLALAWLASRTLTRSPVVRTDALRSVRGAFTMEEAAGLAERAGLRARVVRPHWPRRWLLVWRKDV